MPQEEIMSQFQEESQQLQLVMTQKQALMIQNKEIEKALEEVALHTDDIYKSVGPILIKTTKEKIEGELKENKEEIELKIKALEKQEKRLKDKIKEHQEQMQGFLQGQGG